MASDSTELLKDNRIDPLSDFDLLREFLEGSEAAFEEIVRRHSPMVYSAAIRQVKDAGTAADVTNAAFYVLARKAKRFTPESLIGAWLHRTTRLAALQAIRSRARRQHYEQLAAHMQDSLQQEEHAAAWEEVAPLLDAALVRLARGDHEAVTLRFFEKKSFGEIAAITRSTEEAVRKRVKRSLGKLHGWLTHRGVYVAEDLLAKIIPEYGTEICPADIIERIAPVSTASPLAEDIARTLNLQVWRAIIGIAATLAALTVLFLLVHNSASPLQTFRTLNQAGIDGDGRRWAELVLVTTPEEDQVRQWLSSNIVSQGRLRRALIQQFGPDTYQRSAFPRMLDDLSQADISKARVTIRDAHAQLDLRTGSHLQFVYTKEGWRFDFFRTTRLTPAQLMSQLQTGIPIVQRVTTNVLAGRFTDIGAAARSFKR